MSPSAEEKEESLCSELSWYTKENLKGATTKQMWVYSDARFPMVEDYGTISDTIKRKECGLCRMTKFFGDTYGEDDSGQ